MHPRSKYWHLIDYIITRQADRNDVLDTRAMRGADCGTDHQMLRCKLKLLIRPKHRRTKTQITSKLAANSLSDAKSQAALEDQLNKDLDMLTNLHDDGDVEKRWKSLRSTIYNTALNVLDKPKRKHQDWFDAHDAYLLSLIATRNEARQQMLQRNTRSIQKKYSKAKRDLQAHTRKMKSEWWEKKAFDLQRCADKRDMKAFYSGLKDIYGPQKRCSSKLLALDGEQFYMTRKRSFNDLLAISTNCSIYLVT